MLLFGVALALSLVGLALGPALVAMGRRQPTLCAAVDRLTRILVPLVVLLLMLPHLYEEMGIGALLLAAAGCAGLGLVERLYHDADQHADHAVVVPALIVHSLSDGGTLALALAADGGAGPALLGGALVLHRLGEGLFLATTLTPEIGFRRMLYRVAAVAAATVVGALAGQALLRNLPEAPLNGLVAIGLGMMLRIVLHGHRRSPSCESQDG
ncbi:MULTISPECIES: hypothetical protein [Sorangium]|uniref:Uncharacterized protein n=1 Tax=Sorangium cellulosum TaxID=56 RepID=A0A4P2QUP8_SORCE|nr:MULTISPECIES: hypothetical protein [Sorangium]AUX34055.1 uncharacterized protein SOCE836_062230 [Sorangium cellulosum]WCQ93365.1 hypothetical protein NQZ70_06113 [Sorangium sp. Soce836]